MLDRYGMKITSEFQATIKYIIGWGIVFIIRLLPFRPPNFEPVLSITMPFAKKFGWLGSMLFAFLSIVLFDAFTDMLGSWTLITGVTYAFVGLGAYFYLRNKPNSRKHYVSYAVIGTLFYDAVTGLSTGPLLFGQSFSEAFYGQIPFTIYHLLGNITFSFLASPYIYKWVVENKELEVSMLISKLRTT